MHFEFYNPTRLVFGIGNLSKIGEITKKYGSKALIVTGGGSVKRAGIFDRVVTSLHEAGVRFAECSGVEPNPRIDTVKRGAEIARIEQCDVVIALGGGSTMDAAKVMAAALYYDGDPWDMIHDGKKDPYIPQKALPIITVPTLAATGSEMNAYAVITNPKTKVKSFVRAECLYPKVALVDPELTVSVPKKHTAYGICDLITHVTESYFNGVDHTPIQDRFAEGVILAAMEWGPKALADGHDLQARTQVQWASIVALNGWVSAGTNGAFPVHTIEHTLSAYHDIPHAAGLAVVNPAWMRFAARKRPEKFVQFARRIFGIEVKGPEDIAGALQGIDAFEAFLQRIGCPTRFSDLQIDGTLIPQYAKDTLQVVHDENGNLPGRPPMTEADIITVLQSAL